MTPADRVQWAQQTIEEKFSNLGLGVEDTAKLETLVRYVERHPDDELSNDIANAVTIMGDRAQRGPSGSGGFEGRYLADLYEDLRGRLSPEELEQLQNG